MAMYSKSKDLGHRSQNSTTMADETFGNEANDSKSDSDKIVRRPQANNSIYARSRQRGREKALEMEKRLEEIRKKKSLGTSNSQSSLMDRASGSNVQSAPSALPKPVIAISSARLVPAAAKVTSKEVADVSPNDVASVKSVNVDSGYVTRKETVIPRNNNAAACPVKAPDAPPRLAPPQTNVKSSLPQAAFRNQQPAAVPPPAYSQDDDEYFIINGHRYRLLNLIGSGGSSKVYQVFDEKRKVCMAIKRVSLADADESVVKSYRNEVALLQNLQQYPDRVVRMFDFEYVKCQQLLYVVMEKGDNDLATFLKRRISEKLPDQTIAFYWMEMLKAVQVIHEQGIIHSDLKPANFLIVGGGLKLIDFGIAKAVPIDKTSVTRDCPMGTLSYMSPEQVACIDSGQMDDMKHKISVKTDVWSLGCILYKMVYGKTPFQDLRNPMAIMGAIVNPRHVIAFPPADQTVVNVMRRCLERDAKLRAGIDELLVHPYLMSVSRNGTENSASGVSDDHLRFLAEAVTKTTPRTAARMIKAALQPKVGQNDQKRAFPKDKKF